MIEWCGSLPREDMQSDHYPVIAHINLQLSTKPPELKKQGKVFKPSTSEETKIMVNDILERWAIADKPRTYSDWIFQYQEMMETLPRQESKLFRIKHYISKKNMDPCGREVFVLE